MIPADNNVHKSKEDKRKSWMCRAANDRKEKSVGWKNTERKQ